MKLFHVKQKFESWLRGTGVPNRPAEQNTVRGDSPSSPDSVPTAPNVVSQEFVRSDIKRQPRQERRNSSKVIEWRRRVLIKKGARMRAAMLERSDVGSLAMLDACGVVVYWCERSSAGTSTDSQPSVLKRHVSQFYLPEDVARSAPLLHLRKAAAAGSLTQNGWRKRPDGTTFWATTVIEALSLRGGSLQGFAHIVRETKDPWVTANADSLRELQQREAEGLWRSRDVTHGREANSTGVQ